MEAPREFFQNIDSRLHHNIKLPVGLEPNNLYFEEFLQVMLMIGQVLSKIDSRQVPHIHTHSYLSLSFTLASEKKELNLMRNSYYFSAFYNLN